jgi:hypothetical protein
MKNFWSFFQLEKLSQNIFSQFIIEYAVSSLGYILLCLFYFPIYGIKVNFFEKYRINKVNNKINFFSFN